MNIRLLGSYGGFPTQDDNCVSFLIQSDKANVLVECGSGIAREVQKYIDPKELDAIIVSHLHHDHCSDLGIFGYAYQVGMRHSDLAPLNVYLPLSPTDRVDQFQGNEFMLHPISEDETVVIGDITITFMRTVHDKETYAMVITDTKGNRIGYTADTGYLPELSCFLSCCDIIIGECSLLIDQKANTPNHMTTAEVTKMAEDAGANTLVLVHYWYEIPRQTYVREAIHARKTDMHIMAGHGGLLLQLPR